MMEYRNRRLIVVLGMHRSGTSAVTRALEALGVTLGDNLLPAMDGINERGFFEDVDIVNLNTDLLKELGGDWDMVSLIPKGALAQESIGALKARAVEIMRSKAGVLPFGLKDPRIARLLPFWKDVFQELDLRPAYVIAIRNPRSVASSLQKRDGFDNKKSYFLWLEHVVPAVLETSGLQRVVVDFDLLLASPNEQLTRMARALDLVFDPASPEGTHYAAHFLNDSLRHAHHQPEALHYDSGMPSGVAEAYGILLRAAHDELDINGQEIHTKFQLLDSRLSAQSDALSYASELLAHRADLAKCLRKVTELDDLLTHLYSSRSWRVTKPLRWMNGIFARVLHATLKRT